MRILMQLILEREEGVTNETEEGVQELRRAKGTTAEAPLRLMADCVPPGCGQVRGVVKGGGTGTSLAS